MRFKVNQNYIAKNLCIKKSEPDNCCKGSCQLKKELDEEEKKENAPLNPIKNKNESENQLFFQSKSRLHALRNSETNELISRYNLHLTEKNTSSIFHPPRQCWYLL